MLRVAILGTGAISDSHIQAYLRWPESCCVVAAVDLYPDKAAEKLRKHGLDGAVYKDCEQLLSKESFDVASVCLPPFEHAKASEMLLAAGKHVLVEKPMATCLEECDNMIRAAEASGKLLSVVAQNRFKTPMWKIKQVLDAGLVGRVLHAQIDSFWWRGDNYYDLWWRGTWAMEGGGCTMNHAVHHIDLFQWMMGMPSEVLAVTANLSHANSEVEDFSTALLGYSNGTRGQISASLIHHGEEQQMVFQGEQAKVAVPWQVHAMKQKENGFPDEDVERRSTIQSYYDGLPTLALEGHDGQIANFLKAIRGEEPLLVDGRQGRNTLELVTAIYPSAHLGQKVKLPLAKTDLFYTRDGVLANARHFHEKTKSVENFSANDITLGRNYGK
jgi:UDP-N-acetyl-2-amino-2-deoxyglucuronate dehydrogenase